MQPVRRLGGALLAPYVLSWVFLLASGLPTVWNAERSFCRAGPEFLYYPVLDRVTRVLDRAVLIVGALPLLLDAALHASAAEGVIMHP